MLHDEIRALSDLRMEHAEECLAAARSLLISGNLKSAANRSYYAVFHAMRAVLAYDRYDSKKHSGIISEFRRRYIKTGILEDQMSVIIGDLFDLRTDSDYNDFFVVAKEDVAAQVEHASLFVDRIHHYLREREAQ